MTVICILVFIAVFVGVFYFVRLMQNMGDERVEMAKRNSDECVFANPINRYISDANLIQLRLLVAMTGAGVIAGILILCEITVFACSQLVPST